MCVCESNFLTQTAHLCSEVIPTAKTVKLLIHHITPIYFMTVSSPGQSGAMQRPAHLNPLEPIVGERLSWDGNLGSLVKSPPWANTTL